MSDESQDFSLDDDPKYRTAAQDLQRASRLEAEEDERQATQLARRKRSLSDVAFEAMSRGDQIAVGVGHTTFTGAVTYAAGSLMTIDSGGVTVDVNLQGPIGVSVVEGSRSGGVARGEGPGSFRGRLLELESYPGPIEVGSVLFPQGLQGSIQVAAQDHFILKDPGGKEWVVPLSWVGYVARLNERG